ncbi:MAG TPA: PLP-dependent transferase, partial [Ilumatobacteraceae bacterium]|nr:PLP-dependent transferase [Ilumatobacteraceae bacterium]
DFAASGRFPNFTEPDPSYHGLAYFPALGHGAFIIKARVQLLRDLGAAISPFNAFLILQGLETLSLRMERHFANTAKVVEYLQSKPQVTSINWAGLASSP